MGLIEIAGYGMGVGILAFICYSIWFWVSEITFSIMNIKRVLTSGKVLLLYTQNTLSRREAVARPSSSYSLSLPLFHLFLSSHLLPTGFITGLDFEFQPHHLHKFSSSSSSPSSSHPLSQYLL